MWQVSSAERAFAALLMDGSVVTWGQSDYGGDSSRIQRQLKNVQQLEATSAVFAAVLAADFFLTWGDPAYGGNNSRVQGHLF